MSLTKEQRDTMPADRFAVPGKRALPIHDARHVRMAHSQLSRTQGLSEAERKEAKERILKRAKELGIDTADWDLQALSFAISAMSLAMPDVPDHPNKMPFTGVLTRVDEPSDLPPGGSTGKRVLIPSAVAEEALPSLLGMPIDYTDDFSGHDARSKIGTITEATVSGNAVNIAGFFYANDFPEECARIKAEKNRLGFSYECKVAISDMDADPWVVSRVIFTGAAVLYKDIAAYQTTSLAAKAEQEIKTMDPKEVMDAITKLAAGVESLKTEMSEIKAKGASLAGPIVDQVQPHIVACNAAADGMEAAGVGDHPTKGHARHLRHIASHLAANAAAGKVPHIYRDNDYLENAHIEAKADPKVDALDTKLSALAESVTGITTALADLKAAGFRSSQAPERKTLAPEVVSLLTKVGLEANGTDKLSVHTIDKTLEAAGLKGRSAIEAKLKLQAAGLIAA